MLCGLFLVGTPPVLVNGTKALYVPGNCALLLIPSTTEPLPPFATAPDDGETVSQLLPALTVAFHCSGKAPGLLTVTTWADGLFPPSVPLKANTAGVSCNIGSCPTSSGVVCILTGSDVSPTSDEKIA